MPRFAAALSCLALWLAAAPVAAFDPADFTRRDAFGTILISPNGEYLAATVPREDRTALVVLSRDGLKLLSSFQLGKNTNIEDFWWVNDDRVLMSGSIKIGSLDQPSYTGELFAMDADGSRKEVLAGYRAGGDSSAVTRIKPKQSEYIAAFLVDTLRDDPRNVLVSVQPYGDDPFVRLEKMDVYSGRRSNVARAPVKNTEYYTDNAGALRFAGGYGESRVWELYRMQADGTWQLVNGGKEAGRVMAPVGFSADNRRAYLQIEQAEGPDALVAYDMETGERERIFADARVDPYAYLRQTPDSELAGVMLMDGRPRTEFFDETAPFAVLQRMLENSFPGQAVLVTSTTRDGRLAVVHVWSDRNPGDYYLFDTVARKAAYLVSNRDWIDPEKMRPMEPVTLAARDGLPLHGYLTRPAGADANLPLVVLPHGGPFGIFDGWHFDPEVQMLAAAGYAVLQVNFRGSGNYGRAFRVAGARQWGKAMQDDLTDATRWAIAQGIADPRRICVHGASYGAYAALMGVAREPDLYRCASGHIGVYNLPLMFTAGDVKDSGSDETYLREWIGEQRELDAVSPYRLADRIKVPVLLTAGGEDERAPIAHSRAMERGLRNAGVPVETFYVSTEGHGFYKPENRLEHAKRLLAFLGRHLAPAAAP